MTECPPIPLLKQFADDGACDQLVEVLEHLKSCSHCSNVVERLQDTLAILDAPPEDDPIVPDLERLERIKQRVETKLNAATPTVNSVTTSLSYVRKIGEGGLGEVHEYYDTELGRALAVKLIHRSLPDSRLVRARFDRECRITSTLSHPGIVPVVGSGCLDDGRPYYVMMLVEGRSLAEQIRAIHIQGDAWKRTNSHAVKLTLGLFRQICETLGYAHERKILHRDLKPANIIVGNNGQSIVLDWGLAKFIGDADLPIGEGSDGKDDSDQTQANDRFGTPAYMSPEQANGKTDLIDERTDVYGLGTILFEIITAKPPHRLEARSETSDARRKRELLYEQIESKPTPGTSEIQPNAPRELESICAKAMAKKSDDRYQTVKELIDDLDRWALNDAVIAHDYSITERAARWIRRHPEFAIASVLLLVLAISALAMTNHFRMVATESAIRQNKALLKARETVDSLLTETGESLLLNQPGAAPLRKRILETALRYELEFLNDHGESAELSVEVARAMIRVGQIRVMLGQSDEARPEFERAIEILRRLKNDATHDFRYQSQLSLALTNFGAILFNCGETPKARELFVEANQLALQEAASERASEGSRLQLFSTHSWLAQVAWAEEDKTAGIKQEQLAFDVAKRLDMGLPSSHSKLALIQQNIGGHFRKTGDLKSSLTMMESARAAAEKAVQMAPDDLTFQSQLGNILHRLYLTHLKSGSSAKAVEYLERAHTIRRELARQNPNVVQFVAEHAATCNELAIIAGTKGELDKSAELYALAIEAQRALVNQMPNDVERKSDLASTFNNRAGLFLKKRQFEPAIEDFRQAEKLFEDIIATAPTRTEFEFSKTSVGFNIASLMYVMRDLDNAATTIERVLTTQSALHSNAPDNYEIAYGLAKSTLLKGEILHKGSKFGEAATAFEEYLRMSAPGKIDAENQASDLRTRNHTYNLLCESYRKLDQPSNAFRVAQEKRAINPKNATELYNVACELSLCAAMFGSETPESEQAASEALSALRDAVAMGVLGQTGMKAHINEDSDLDAIRQLPEFQEIIGSN